MANHLYQSLWLTHEKQGARARAYVTLFSSGGAPALLWLCVSSLRKLCKKIASPKDPFVETDQYVLTFRHSILVCRGSHTQHCWGWMLLPNWLVHMSHLPLSLLNPGGICLSYFTPLERALTLWPERL